MAAVGSVEGYNANEMTVVGAAYSSHFHPDDCAQSN